VANEGGGIRIGTPGTPTPATLTNCTVSGNSARYGGGILNYLGILSLKGCSVSGNSAFDGGGILNRLGTLSLSRCTVLNNVAFDAGGGIENASGTLTATSSTLSGNWARQGGGLSNRTVNPGPATATVINCTVSGNSAISGGGIRNELGTLVVAGCTLSDNSADSTLGGGIANASAGSTTTLTNTIVANSVGSADVANLGGTLAGGGNLIEDGSGGLADTITGDPRLGLLANNGGPSPTMALLTGSPAIDAGTSALVPPGVAFDQRGAPFARVVGSAVDIGAFEVQPPVVIDPAALPAGLVGTAYSQTLTASGPPGPFTFAVMSGVLPPGLTLTSSGVLGGTPTKAGSYAFTVSATGAGSQSGSRAYSLTVYPPVVVAPTTLPAGMVGKAYSQTLTASGPPGPFTFAVSAGALPPGLTLSDTGVLSGTPTASGAFAFTVSASGAAARNGSRAYTLTIHPPVVISPATLPTGQIGKAYSQTLTASGPPGAFVFSVTAGALPPGLTLNRGGVLGGTPTTVGAFTFTVTATTAASWSGSRAYTLTILPPVVVSPATLPTGQVGTAYSQTFTASGSSGPFTFTINTGALPPGLTLSRGGVLDGTPTATGVYGFSVTATGATQNGSRAYTLTVVSRPLAAGDAFTVLAGTTLTVAAPGVLANDTGMGPLTAQFVGGPAGGSLTLGLDGSFSYTPAAGFRGIDAFTYRVVDALSTASGVATVTITVNPPPAVPQPAAVGGLPDGTARLLLPSNGQYVIGASLSFFADSAANVRTATADVTGDGVPDLVGGTGPGVVNSVAIIDGATHATLVRFAAFEETFRGGLYVAAADLDGDGRAEVVVTPDESGGPVVAIYRGSKLAAGVGGQEAQVNRFFGIEGDPNFRGGCRPALGDVNGDGVPDLVVAAGVEGGPRVALFDGAGLETGGDSPPKLIGDFFAFESTTRNGTFVAAGDVTGDGFADLAFGGGPGGAGRVRVFDGRSLLGAGHFDSLDEVAFAQRANFFAGDPKLRGGVRIALRDVNGDASTDLVTGSGEGEASLVRVYTSANLLANLEPAPDQELDPFGGAVLAGGVFVG
jgi:hypothetical protein